MKNRGMTILEAITGIAIIFILGSVLSPVFARSRREAQTTQSITELRQIHIGLSLYQQEWGGDPGAVTPDDLRYPSVRRTVKFVPDEPKGTQSLWRSPCGDDRDIFESGPTNLIGYKTYAYAWFEDLSGDPVADRPYYRYLETYQQNAMLAVDVFCNEPGTDFRNPFSTKRLLGISFSGQLWNRMRAVSAPTFHAFSDPQAGNP